MALTFDTGAIALPPEASARTPRRYLRREGARILGLTLGDFRPYVFPLFTPAGFAVTSEAPADHPHHQSVWIGADPVRALVPASAGAFEDYTYNFYVNDVFHGRAPGRIVENSVSFTAHDSDAGEICQRLEWRSPAEWGAPQGRLILEEIRTLHVGVHADATVLLWQSQLAGNAWPIRLGPTRHAYFNVRVAESMQAMARGRSLDQRGLSTGNTQTPEAEWIDYIGPVGGGREAGVALMPLSNDAADGWFVSDWGVMTWGPFRHQPCDLAPGDVVTFGACVVAHDGDIGPDRLSALRAGMIVAASAP